MTDLRGPDEFKASDERRGRERQIRTAIALARLVNLREERLLKTSWTFLVFVAVLREHFKRPGMPGFTFLPASQSSSPSLPQSPTKREVTATFPWRRF